MTAAYHPPQHSDRKGAVDVRQYRDVSVQPHRDGTTSIRMPAYQLAAILRDAYAYQTRTAADCRARGDESTAAWCDAVATDLWSMAYDVNATRILPR